MSVAPAVGAQLTIGELGARYVEQQRRQGRKRASIVAVESVLRIRLEPYFGDRAIDTITPEDVADFMRTLEEGRKPGSTGKPRPLSVKSIRNYMIHLSALFNLAERKGWATATRAAGSTSRPPSRPARTFGSSSRTRSPHWPTTPAPGRTSTSTGRST